MKLRARALGLAIGIVLGFVFFVAIMFSLLFGAGATFGQVHYLFGLGVSRTIFGAIVGFVWGFVYGFIGGALIAWLYNFFHRVLYKSLPAT